MTDESNTLLLIRLVIFVSSWLLGGGLFVLLYVVGTGGIDMSPWKSLITAYLTAISVLLLTQPQN
jgi:hypothetical protein